MTEQIKSQKNIAIITPVYNEEDALPVYIRAVEELFFSHQRYNFNVLLVDDGSSDKSWQLIEKICEKHDQVRGIRLSRNYGSHIALSAGFANVTADAVATLACDLQDPPETILQFLEKWETGVKIVWGKRKKREDQTWKKITSTIFHKLMQKFAMPAGSKFTTGSFFLVDKLVAESFNQFHESNRITFALVAWTGFQQDTVHYDRERRTRGKSGWSFRKMLKTMYDAFIGFSFAPIRVITLLGISTSLVSFLLGAYVLLLKLEGNPIKGWTSLVLAFSFFFGIQFLILGIIGEYLYRIYLEVVRRPLYFISESTDTETATINKSLQDSNAH